MSGSTKTHEATSEKGVALCISRLKKALLGLLPAILLGIAATLSVLATLDLAHDLEFSTEGPGLTFDEPLNLHGGVYLVEMSLNFGVGLIHPSTQYEIFNSPQYYPDYPPLGRLPAALSNALLTRVFSDPVLYRITYGRVGTAIVFGMLISLVTAFTSSRVSPRAGLCAGLVLWTMPHVFGHAHLASVETMMNFTYALCVLGTCWYLSERQSLTARDGVIPAVLLGLALLTKIQAIFLPPILVYWLLRNWRRNSLATIVVLAVTSFLVFVVGWPWLWGDPIGRFMQYFGQATERVTLYCYYFGERYADREVPWHYCWIMFIATTPLVYLLAGAGGLWKTYRPSVTKHTKSLLPRDQQLLAAAFLFPLIVFSIPGAAVYDGTRLFLIVWPIFAIWAGIGLSELFEALQRRLHRNVAAVALSIVVLMPVISLVRLHPCQLSYYSMNGLPFAAQRLHLEATYWGDSLTPGFLEQTLPLIPQNTTVGIAPILHPTYLESLKQETLFRTRPDLKIVAFDDKSEAPPEHVFLIRRLADPWDVLLKKDERNHVVSQLKREGVPLADYLIRSNNPPLQ